MSSIGAKLDAPTILDSARIETAWTIADVLVPETDDRPSLKTADPEARWLAVAFAARRDSEHELAVLLDILRGREQSEVEAMLRSLRVEKRYLFDTISSVIAGAYYMTPQVRALIGYPGQEQRPAPLELAADELSDEIFEGAMAYGGAFRAPSDFVV